MQQVSSIISVNKIWIQYYKPRVKTIINIKKLSNFSGPIIATLYFQS